MPTLRAAIRLACFISWTLSLFALFWVGRLLLPKHRIQPWQNWAVQRWGRGVLYILGVRLQTFGTPPKPPFILVSNHLSYLDIPLLYTRIPTIFLAKSEVSKWPVLGPICEQVETVFIKRFSTKDLQRVREILQEKVSEHRGITFFPEGSTSDGTAILPFHSGLFELARDTGLPVYCAVLTYQNAPGDPPAGTHVCWHGDDDFMPHFWTMLKMRRIYASLHFGGAVATQNTPRKETADRCRAEIEGLLEQAKTRMG